MKHKGKSVSYLGLDITKQDDGGYVVASPGTRNDIMMKFGHLIKNLRGPATPMSDLNMRDVGSGEPLNPRSVHSMYHCACH